MSYCDATDVGRLLDGDRIDPEVGVELMMLFGVRLGGSIFTYYQD